MKIIVNESQYKKLLFEETSKNSIDKLKDLKKFFNDLKNDVKNQIGLDLSFLSTWGVTIAGFVRPIAEFMEGNFPELTTTEIALLSTGIILTYYQSNRQKLLKVLSEIKEKGLVFEFDMALGKAELLKNTFINFIDSLAVPISRISNMLAYTFLIPLVPELYEMAQGYGVVDLKEFAMRIVGFIGVTLSGNLIKKLIKAMVGRFKS